MNASALTPIQSQNSEIYEAFVKKTVPHSRGYFILAPSGAGKTHYISTQSAQHWIDGDALWVAAGAQPKTDWWNQGITVIKEVDAKSDEVTKAAKQFGLWIMGASNNWLPPDAIVLPPWDVNVERIGYREKNNYDGGLTSDKLAQLRSHRKEMEDTAATHNVPIFPSIEEAVNYITSLYEKSLRDHT